MGERVYDCRGGFDHRVIDALRMVGVNLLEHVWSSGRLRDHKIVFSFVCNTEFAKGIMTDFIADEYDGSHCRFYAVRGERNLAYVIYDEGKVDIHANSEAN